MLNLGPHSTGPQQSEAIKCQKLNCLQMLTLRQPTAAAIAVPLIPSKLIKKIKFLSLEVATMSAKKIQPLLALTWPREGQGGYDLQGGLQIMAIFL